MDSRTLLQRRIELNGLQMRPARNVCALGSLVARSIPFDRSRSRWPIDSDKVFTTEIRRSGLC